MENDEKMTLAQVFLWELLKVRKLKAWCAQRGLPHTTVYKVASGDSVPTYAVICSLLPFIPYTDWYFFKGEKIPYERKTIDAWKADDVPAFIRQHKHDWAEQGRIFGMTESFARNLFVNHRARPTLNMVRQAALNGIDPVVFFTAGDPEDDGVFYPEHGDIVALFGKEFLVLSESRWNSDNSAFFGVETVDGKPDVLTAGIRTFQRKYPCFVKKADGALVKKIADEIKGMI